MADINVERRGPRIWPWIIGLLILVILIWLIAELVGRESTPSGETIEVVPEPVAPGPPVQAPGAPEPTTPAPGTSPGEGTPPGTGTPPGAGTSPGTGTPSGAGPGAQASPPGEGGGAPGGVGR